MAPEARRFAALGLLVALLAAAAAVSGCSGGDRPFRIGVIADCVGINRSLRDAELSGAELPLIQRGAEPRDRRARDGVSPVDVGGRSVQLVPGCTELWEFSALTTEVRRLVESEHVDAVVAAGSGPDEIVLREVARKYPDVLFLPAVHGPREVTLDHPAANVYRVGGDFGQGVAGLATYAYRRLGWRRAAVVLLNWDAGWGARDAFAAEFCSLGGRIHGQLALDTFDPAGRDVADIPRNVDGVAVFAPGIFGPAGLLNRLARRFKDPARHIVVGPSVTGDPALLRSTRRALAGVIGSSYVDPERIRDYLRAYERAFPGVPTDVAGSELVTSYHDAVASLLAALENAEGSSARLSTELAHLHTNLLGGPVRLDRNRQAIADTSLVRIEPPGAPPPGLARVRTIRGVHQSVGQLLSPSMVPSDRGARCRTGRRPPPWSR